MPKKDQATVDDETTRSTDASSQQVSFSFVPSREALEEIERLEEASMLAEQRLGGICTR